MSKINVEQRKANFLQTHRVVALMAFNGDELARIKLKEAAKAANFIVQQDITQYFKKAWQRINS